MIVYLFMYLLYIYLCIPCIYPFIHSLHKIKGIVKKCLKDTFKFHEKHLISDNSLFSSLPLPKRKKKKERNTWLVYLSGLRMGL